MLLNLDVIWSTLEHCLKNFSTQYGVKMEKRKKNQGYAQIIIKKQILCLYEWITISAIS